MHANTVAQSVSWLRRLLTMSSFGTAPTKRTFQMGSMISLNTREMSGAQNVERSGQVPKSGSHGATKCTSRLRIALWTAF